METGRHPARNRQSVVFIRWCIGVQQETPWQRAIDLRPVDAAIPLLCPVTSPHRERERNALFVATPYGQTGYAFRHIGPQLHGPGYKRNLHLLVGLFVAQVIDFPGRTYRQQTGIERIKRFIGDTAPCPLRRCQVEDPHIRIVGREKKQLLLDIVIPDLGRCYKRIEGGLIGRRRTDRRSL